jgi:hypothetical protein
VTELDALKKAMRASDPHMVPNLDLAAIMADGRRLRVRRRLSYGGAGAASVAAAAVAVLVLVNPAAGPPTRPQQPASSGSATVSATPEPGETTPPPLGDLIHTGLRDSIGERVFFFAAVDIPGQPGVTIGIHAGRLSDTGVLTGDYTTNDVKGSDRSPGFHTIGSDPSGRPPDASSIPTFGYFVGPARRIEGVVKGRTILAAVASWSEDKNVKLFFFDPTDLPPGQDLDGIRAYDSAGRKL